MIRNLYLVLAVVIRSAGLYVVLRGVFTWGAALVMTRGGGFGVPALVMFLPIIGGLLLWFLAKPLAALVTKDLD